MSKVLQFWYVAVALICIAGIIGAVMVRQYRYAAGSGLMTFTQYVMGNLRLAIGSRLNPALAAQFGLKRYAMARLASFPDHLSVPSVSRHRLPLDEAYIRLSLAASPSVRISDSALLDEDAGTILIFGEPGSGKSSLTRKLFREQCKAACVQHLQSRLPIHLELNAVDWRSMPADEELAEAWLLSQLRTAVSGVQGQHSPDFLFNAFRVGPGFTVFLDGMDEITSAYLERACTAIGRMNDSLRESSAHTVVIVTARTQLRGSLPRRFVDRFNAVLTVEPFSPADVFSFLRRWPFCGSRLSEAQRVFEQLRNKPTLFDMCTNPLVLGMYVAQDQRYADVAAGSARLPDTRPDFYREVIGELLFFRREEKLGRAVAGAQLRRSREQLLGEIALDHLADSDDPANSLSFDRAVTIAHRLQGAATLSEAGEHLQQLSIDTGIFAEERPGESLRFMHLTLCEFLAARELAERSDAAFDVVVDKVLASDDRRLWETIAFAVALTSRARRFAVLIRMRSAGASRELMLRCMRESQLYDSSVFPAVLDDLTDELRGVDVDEWNAEWFVKVRLVLSCLTDARRLAEVHQGLAKSPIPSRWLRLLIGGASDAKRLDRVFDLYLAASPTEALHAARDYGLLDRLLSDYRRIVVAMEQPDLVGYGMHAVTEDLSGNRVWLGLLTEAALAHELVARTLMEDPIPRSLESALGNVPARYAWHRLGPAAGRFYGAVLALVAHSHPDRPTGSPRKLSRTELFLPLDASRRGRLAEVARWLDRAFTAPFALQKLLGRKTYEAEVMLNLARTRTQFELPMNTVGLIALPGLTGVLVRPDEVGAAEALKITFLSTGTDSFVYEIDRGVGAERMRVRILPAETAITIVDDYLWVEKPSVIIDVSTGIKVWHRLKALLKRPI